MKALAIIVAVSLLAGCAVPAVRCDTHLRPINVDPQEAPDIAHHGPKP